MRQSLPSLAATGRPPDQRRLIPGITTIILTFNEEIHIERAIANAKLYSREIMVVDSFSTDRTVELAQSLGARVIQNKWVNHARQIQFALDQEIHSTWVLRLDADELIGADLIMKLNAELQAMPADVAGILFNRRHIFMGRWVRHGGRYPLLMLRLWRNGQGEVEDRWMDEHMLVHGGRTVRMNGEFSDASEYDVAFFITKHNGYAAREAIDVLDKRYNLFDKPRAISAENSSWQASLKRSIKENIYNRLPFGYGPLCYFLFRYVAQLGFLDGKTGLIYHFLQGLWYRFLVDVKILEFERAMEGCKTREDRLAVLRHVSGLEL